jgi:uncharacterized membrane protein
MLYNYLKILHIFCASLLVTSMAYSFWLWRERRSARVSAVVAQRIQTQTWLIIIPVALLQLLSGFTMISLQEEDLTQFWIVGSVIGYVVLIGSWVSFLYFLLLAQQIPVETVPAAGADPDRSKAYRRAQSAMLVICAAALLSMIFFMSNKIS